MIKIPKASIWNTSVPRALLEALLTALAFITTLILVSDELPEATINSGILFTSVIAGTISGFRIRISDAPLQKRAVRFILVSLTLSSLLTSLTWLICVLAGKTNLLIGNNDINQWLAILILLACPAVYFCWRLFGIVWRRWQQMRRTRFAWSLTAAFANLITGLILFVWVIYFTLNLFDGYSSNVDLSTASWMARVLRSLAVTVFPWLMIFWLGLVIAMMVTIPPVMLFSYLVTRKLSLRIEELARATQRLQSGELSARTAVNGYDEVAQLQTAFNQMAENLEYSNHALQAERDKVTTLLKTQRELTATISHELRTPVATLHAYLENNLTQNTALAPDLHDDLTIMLHETQQLQKMVDDLFLVAQSDANQLSLNIQPVQLVPLLMDWVHKFQPVIWQSHKVDLQCETNANLPVLQVDPQRLEQIVNNLVQNAVRHTPPGGMVQVQATAVEQDKIRLSVRDTGEGIPADEVEHVWQRYFRGKHNQHQGSGLGLSLVKELAESMGAQVGVESQPGEGSHFWVEWGDRNQETVD